MLSYLNLGDILRLVLLSILNTHYSPNLSELIRTENTKARIFIFPGEVAGRFFLEIFNFSKAAIQPENFWLLSLILALIFWVWVIKILIAVIQKLFGFYHPGRK